MKDGQDRVCIAAGAGGAKTAEKVGLDHFSG
jgi:hypothetical protein